MTLLLSRDQVAQVLTMPACIDAVEGAFAALARGEADMPQRAVIKIPAHHGVFLGMPAFLGGQEECLGLKLVTVYPDNPSRHGLATTLGTLMLCDPQTGAVTAIMDAGFLTAVRTGAASGVATRYLAREDAAVCTVFGAGVQARQQLIAVHHVRPLVRALVLDQDPAAAAAFASDLSARLDLPVEVSTDPAAAVRAADIVVTATSSPTPILDGAWVRPGIHINNIGSHAPTTRELDTATVAKSYFVADLREANLAEAGDILIPIAEGAVTADHIRASLGEVVIGRKPGRTDADQVTVFKSCGLAVQDVSTARAVAAAARAAGIGTEVTL
ncbi:MAG: ornithine cyclodeaminase family protein [Candidatus Krumholzibacteriia bacterium]